MKSYTKTYLTYFGYSICDFIPCEIPECGKRAVDIHHLEGRGMGGNPSGDKNEINNLMAVCREHHVQYGDKKQFIEWLKEVHLEFMKNNAK